MNQCEGAGCSAQVGQELGKGLYVVVTDRDHTFCSVDCAAIYAVPLVRERLEDRVKQEAEGIVRRRIAKARWN